MVKTIVNLRVYARGWWYEWERSLTVCVEYEEGEETLEEGVDRLAEKVNWWRGSEAHGVEGHRKLGWERADTLSSSWRHVGDSEVAVCDRVDDWPFEIMSVEVEEILG